MARTKTEVASYKSTVLRLPEWMLVACKAQAAKKRRSLNAQLLCIIEDSLNNTKESASHELVYSERD